VDDDVSVESSANDEPAISDVTDDVDLTSSPSPAATATKAVCRREDNSPVTYRGYSSKLGLTDGYFPALPFHYQQRLLTAEERLLLPLVHSILLQRHHHHHQQQQQLHLQAASAVLSADRQTAAAAAGLKLSSLDGMVAGTAQTSPAGPVGATVDVSPPALYPCSECGRAYSTASNLARHRQSHRSTTINREHHQHHHHHHHQQQQQQQEQECGGPTPPDGRNDNTATVVTTSRKCPHCDKVYASAPAYSMHVRTHSQGCECPQCGKTFADKSNLRAHIQTHSTDKPHVCGRCGKAFALRSYLYKHEESSCMRSHRLYHGYAYLHHHQHQQQQRRHQRQLSPVLRTAAVSQIPCQL